MKKFSAFLIGTFAFAAIEAVAQTPAAADARVSAQADPAKRAEHEIASTEKSHPTNEAAKSLSGKVGLPARWRPADLRWRASDARNSTTPRHAILI